MLAVLLNSIKLQKKRKVLSEEKIQNMECCRTCLNAEDLEPIFNKQLPEKRRSAEIKTVTGLQIDSSDGLSQKICKICSKTIKLSLKLRQIAFKSQTTLLKIESKKLLKKQNHINKESNHNEHKKTNQNEHKKSNHNQHKKPNHNQHKKSKRETVKLKSKTKVTKDSTCNLSPPILPPLPTEEIKSDIEITSSFPDSQIEAKPKIEADDINTATDALPYSFETTVQKEEWPFEYEDYDHYDDGSEQPLLVEKRTRGRRGTKIAKLPVGSKPYCNECKKDFLSEKSYKIHMKLHLDCCVCELCGKKCRNNNLLLLHKRGKHGAERIHKCSYCDYAGASREALTIHERRHTGEKPYICDHCGSGFHRRSNLIQHIAIHLPDKNFQCDICNKKVKSRKFLQIHKHSAHTGKRYLHLCPVCPRRFEKPNKVRAHLRTAHAVQEAPDNIVRIEVAKRGFLPVPYPEINPNT